ncbi:histone H2A-Bbd type 1-like [Perognathus longimembris pacificus]|uniref:histone H2A-Bbd type 1-like n=1 Tax=Perognathus longimembris pacificus TaxID=214514 RepID=UPI002018A6D0|nr:histone H2A-Bbd type 1-like [Perognathus longimembris pacificus]
MAKNKRSNRRKSKKSPVSRSARAELQFPVSRVDRLLREGNYAQRLSSLTPVFLTGILEYLVSNILELAGKEARRNGKARITPEHVKKVIESQKQFQLFYRNIQTLDDQTTQRQK